jgi:hypothetical protein
VLGTGVIALSGSSGTGVASGVPPAASNDQLAGLSQNQEPAGGGAWIVGALA